MWTVSFWKQTVERAVRTTAQVALSFWVLGQTSFMDVDWAQVAGVAGLAALTSVLMSLVATGMNDKDNPSMVKM